MFFKRFTPLGYRCMSWLLVGIGLALGVASYSCGHEPRSRHDPPGSAIRNPAQQPAPSAFRPDSRLPEEKATSSGKPSFSPPDICAMLRAQTESALVELERRIIVRAITSEREQRSDDLGPAEPSPQELSAMRARLEAENKVSASSRFQSFAHLKDYFRQRSICRRTHSNGAWAVSFKTFEFEERSSTIQAQWSLVHVKQDGSRAETTPDLGNGNVVAVDLDDFMNFNEGSRDEEGRSAEPARLELSDYDGDGQEEAVLLLEDYNSYEIGPWTDFYTGVFTHKGDKVTVYPPASGLSLRLRGFEYYPPATDRQHYLPNPLSDVDGDGRLDLLTQEPFIDSVDDCAAQRSVGAAGPPFLVHALPDGNFSTTDGAAAKFIREQCPVKPGETAPKTLYELVCKRVLGVRKEKILAQLKKGNHGKSRCGRAEGSHCGEECVDLEAWLETRPLLQLMSLGSRRR